jgi:hypothetical protein
MTNFNAIHLINVEFIGDRHAWNQGNFDVNYNIGGMAAAHPWSHIQSIAFHCGHQE